MAGVTVSPAASAPVSFNQEIRPILADECYACHGPDKGTRKAGLRLDDRDAALKGVKGRPAIVPGNSAASELYKRIISTDPSYRMPAKETGHVLSPQQIALFKAWIDQGAKYEKHWAYVAPVKREPPPVKDRAWVRNPIDSFLLADWEKQGLQPSPEADRRTLLRRLSFDLIGLPPTPEEVAAFEADKAPGAYERQVDRLLASPHYGERMALYWLDLVRFADTVGYHGDQNIDVWPYRDYVIRSFNQNKSFAQFTREQLAGDLLPNATTEQKVASAYNRLNMVTREGGAQPKEYLAKYAADRVRTTTTTWLASTIGCAECHDHKFDPFTQKDFYSFEAFFADVKEQGVYASSAFYSPFPPTIRVADGKDEQKLNALAARIDAAMKEEGRLGQLSTNLHSGPLAATAGSSAGLNEVASQLHLSPEALTASFSNWQAHAQERIQSARPKEMVLVIEDKVQGGNKEENWRLVNRANGKRTHSGKRVRIQSGQGLVQHYAAEFKHPHTVLKGDRLYAYIYLDPKKLPETVMVQCDTGGRSWTHRAYWGKDLIEFGGIGRDAPDHRHLGDLPAAGKWVRLEIDADKVGLEPGQEIQGLAFTQFGGRAWWDDAGVLTEDLPPAAVVAVLKKAPESWTEQDRAALLAGFVDEGPLHQAKEQAANARQAKDAFENSLPLCVVTEAVKPRTIRILARGNWMDESGQVVEPAVPHFLPQPKCEPGQRLTRLDLANWLVSRDNPLTARVFVNRLWKSYFGTGLSKILDDLGTRGDWPHQEHLLDWLAVEFMDSGWDVKHMVRLMVTSSAYRQTSKPSEKLKDLDPYNRFFARQSRWRLEAEIVRDNALAISDLLTTTIGGPSANPYQPADYYKELNFPKRTYTPDKGPNQYRRGIYTHWQRTFLHPAMAAFDAPTREECTAERNISNTPLQALTLLNDPTYVEASRVFAEHILEQGGADFDQRLHWAYNRALDRSPTPSETNTMKTLFDEQLATFQAKPQAAKELAQVGYAPVPDKLNPSQLAAWTSVGRTLLNLHETIVRY